MQWLIQTLNRAPSRSVAYLVSLAAGIFMLIMSFTLNSEKWTVLLPLMSAVFMVLGLSEWSSPKLAPLLRMLGLTLGLVSLVLIPTVF